MLKSYSYVIGFASLATMLTLGTSFIGCAQDAGTGESDDAQSVSERLESGGNVVILAGVPGR